MLYMVTRYSPKAGRSDGPLPAIFSAHTCTHGKTVGIKESYSDRGEAEAAAARLERHISDPSCLYQASEIRKEKPRSALAAGAAEGATLNIVVTQ